ncbi:MAG TPA: type III pantothenate kinase [Gemmatimonadaceae bacterium]|nr:type III pantothenate kinase [Gemmatimonadaceae bacterium]
MNIVIDAGNSETTIGTCHGLSVMERWRITTEASRTPDEIFLTLSALLATARKGRSRITGAAIGSVVPALTTALAEACERIAGAPPVIVDGRSKLPIRLEVDEPLTVGADRIINTLAASRLHRRDCIVVDLGTATTFDCITADGTFLGGVIAPGVQIAAESLFRRTSKLSATELVAPRSVIGTRTEECIRAGVVLGAAESIDGLVRRIKQEWPNPEPPMVIATGGLAVRFGALCEQFDRIEPDLTLIGLAMAHELLTVKKKGSGRRR